MRRSPVIHRGYWLRMKAISEVVRIFLEESSDRPKVVLNLGCGAYVSSYQDLTGVPSRSTDWISQGPIAFSMAGKGTRTLQECEIH